MPHRAIRDGPECPFRPQQFSVELSHLGCQRWHWYRKRATKLCVRLGRQVEFYGISLMAAVSYPVFRKDRNPGSAITTRIRALNFAGRIIYRKDHPNFVAT